MYYKNIIPFSLKKMPGSKKTKSVTQDKVEKKSQKGKSKEDNFTSDKLVSIRLLSVYCNKARFFLIVIFFQKTKKTCPSSDSESSYCSCSACEESSTSCDCSFCGESSTESNSSVEQVEVKNKPNSKGKRKLDGNGLPTYCPLCERDFS